MWWLNDMFISKLIIRNKWIFTIKATVYSEFIIYSAQMLSSAIKSHTYKILKPALISSGTVASMLLPRELYIMKSQWSVNTKWAKRAIICVIKANVTRSQSTSHCYHSMIHLYRNDSRDGFSRRGRNCVTVQHIPHSHISSLHLLLLSFCSQVLYLVKQWCLKIL